MSHIGFLLAAIILGATAGFYVVDGNAFCAAITAFASGVNGTTFLTFIAFDYINGRASK